MGSSHIQRNKLKIALQRLDVGKKVVYNGRKWVVVGDNPYSTLQF